MNKSSPWADRPTNPLLLSGRDNLKAAFDARAECLAIVLSFKDAGPEDEAVQQLEVQDAKAMVAAQQMLDAPVHGPGDLYAKYNTIALYAEFYRDQPSLMDPILDRMRDDAKQMLDDSRDWSGKEEIADPT